MFFPVNQKSIVGTYKSGETTKTEDALTVFVSQHFVINESDIFGQYRLKHTFVIGLLFDGMRKEEIGFMGQQRIGGELFDV